MGWMSDIRVSPVKGGLPAANSFLPCAPCQTISDDYEY